MYIRAPHVHTDNIYRSIVRRGARYARLPIIDLAVFTHDSPSLPGFFQGHPGGHSIIINGKQPLTHVYYYHCQHIYMHTGESCTGFFQ